MKALGKKKTAQNGTLVAFACDCISVCKSLASCNCATDITLALVRLFQKQCLAKIGVICNTLNGT